MDVLGIKLENSLYLSSTVKDPAAIQPVQVVLDQQTHANIRRQVLGRKAQYDDTAGVSH
jgi:hypothetical protein